MGIGSDLWASFFNIDIEAQLEAALEQLRNKAKKSWSTQCRGLIEAHRAEKLVFVLGAGVSLQYGLPDWPLLLQELLIRTLGEAKDADKEQSSQLALAYTKFFSPDPLMAARYTRLRLKEDFVKAVREVLYARVGEEKDLPLMSEIRNFAVAAGRTPNLDSIITFNFDDLLERSIDRLPVRTAYQVIDDDQIRPSPGKLPIYHVHGFLPRDPSLRPDPKITLSEDDYHARYADIYHWSNIVQINKFRDNTCLFIGLSFSDPNLRRLLDIAQRQRGDGRQQHYLVSRRSSVAEAEAALQAIAESQGAGEASRESIDPAAIRRRVEKLVALTDQIREEDAASFGVSIIWVDDFAKIPGLLAQVYGGVPPKAAASASR